MCSCCVSPGCAAQQQFGRELWLACWQVAADETVSNALRMRAGAEFASCMTVIGTYTVMQWRERDCADCMSILKRNMDEMQAVVRQRDELRQQLKHVGALS